MTSDDDGHRAIESVAGVDPARALAYSATAVSIATTAESLNTDLLGGQACVNSTNAVRSIILGRLSCHRAVFSKSECRRFQTSPLSRITLFIAMSDPHTANAACKGK
ncbi:hypothetical protein FHS27_006027 [Rhodopirellula rubra]|uniref:Uncharacterized protein n=1 Tax=Aporhodopirellula rubra TaxID=980271 RepID=A0A7W5E4R8_9BACT|nr:hypothetical protein [Aporhodopirellula rubra]